MKLVSEELAKLAKAKGFDYKCNHVKYIDEIEVIELAYWEGDGTGIIENSNAIEGIFSGNEELDYTVPYKSQLQDWFREEKNINITIYTNDNTGENWVFEIINIILTNESNLHYESEFDHPGFKTYDRALNGAFKEAFKHI